MSQVNEVWTIGRVLTWTQQYFKDRGIDTPRLDAELLLAFALKKNRVQLYTHFDQPLSQVERDAVRALVLRRAAREPVAFILGEREFYGRSFVVNRDVLVPRPETEHLVDAVREWLDARSLTSPRLLDLGTGSGALAVTLAALYPEAQVSAVDISALALTVARQNAACHGVQVHFYEGDLFAPLEGLAPFDVIVANPPYIPKGEQPSLQPEVRDYEPALALFGGDDGLSIIRRLVAQAPTHLARPGLLAFEMGDGQWSAVQPLLQQDVVFAQISCRQDLAGKQRVALASLA